MMTKTDRDATVKPLAMSSVSKNSPRYVVGRPGILNQQRFLERVQDILNSGWHTNDGPMVQELESFAAARFDVRNCISVANATLGLELVLQCLRLPRQSKVIVPSFTFVASAHSIVRSDLQLVFCDVDERGLVDCDEIDRLIDDETSAIMAVNIYGLACDTERLEYIAKRNRLALVFDSAHGIGVRTQFGPLGGHGNAEVFSLHATKIISGFEGGLITTNSQDLANALRLARNFGFSGYDCVASIGTNAKLSEIHAAMALTNFEELDKAIAHNATIFATYLEAVKTPARLISPLANESSNYQYVAVKCPAQSRERILEHLLQNGIFARRYFYPGVHRMEPYGARLEKLPQTDLLCEQILCLPTGQDISIADAEYIAKVFNSGLEQTF
ncbi:MAG: DegT/DnrJ/EryC1/StrS family aminotransferase [Candidatus Melainabacteria bacterium]|nr:DegT/DnrJ/EryC1/StrS family aminotransferase [Candidatus Melainabacteria bacterium]